MFADTLRPGLAGPMREYLLFATVGGSLGTIGFWGPFGIFAVPLGSVVASSLVLLAAAAVALRPGR